MALFSQNSHSYIDEYSQAFEKAFMELVRRRWRFKDILAKKVYNEYIQDKEHVHMNATRWITLTDFVHHLDTARLCDVRDTEEGLVIRYIDRDPQREAKQASIRAREKEELEQREIERKRLLRTVKAMEDKNTGSEEIAPSDAPPAPTTDPTIKPSTSPISFSFSAPKPTLSLSLTSTPSSTNQNTIHTASPPFEKAEIPIETESNKKRLREEAGESHEGEPFAKKPKLAPAESSAPVSKPIQQSKLSAPKATSSTGSSLDSIMEAQERRREIEGRKDYWLHPQIVVKILNKVVGNGQFYKQKGTIIEVEDKYLAKIKLENGTILKVDQDDLETVLPALHSPVLIVNGAYRGEKASLQAINQDKFNATVTILAGPAKGRTLTKTYEDICKLV